MLAQEHLAWFLLQTAAYLFGACPCFDTILSPSPLWYLFFNTPAKHYLFGIFFSTLLQNITYLVSFFNDSRNTRLTVLRPYSNRIDISYVIKNCHIFCDSFILYWIHRRSPTHNCVVLIRSATLSVLPSQAKLGAKRLITMSRLSSAKGNSFPVSISSLATGGKRW